MNRLANEKSPYLRHSANQRIDWHPWSEEAFELARAGGKPVFLSSGGVWCHWCHVMAKECFEDDEIAALVNELFVSVKIDRDERPDIDRRYQQAVAAMTGGGTGWPLTVFLTPDKKPFFGGTYFPPEDSAGRPGFKKILRAVREFYDQRPGDAASYAERVMEVLARDAARPGVIDQSMIGQTVSSLLSAYDPDNGGFGKAPKFPMPGALEFLIRRAWASQSTFLVSAVQNTLDSMARGGVYDQLAGGFHRYSTDEGWFVPHFEKMADDNAWLLRIYSEAFGVFGDPLYRDTAMGIIRFVREELSDPAGGFYASQDADVTPDDEGGYFTWTDEDFRRGLTEEEYRALSLHLFDERGGMHHDRSKKALCVAAPVSVIAGRLGLEEREVEELIRRGKGKMLEERRRRKAPFVDTTLYTSLNGAFIASFLAAYRILGDAWARDFALLSLDRILAERFRGGELYHAEGVRAGLDDYVHLIEALVAAYEATGDPLRLSLADDFMKRCMERFGDAEGGFFDTETEVLGARLKRIEDVPHPSANAVAVIQLIKLFHLTGNDEYLGLAEKALRIFSPLATELGVHGGMYAEALNSFFSMVRFTVGAPVESELGRAARALAGPPTVIVYGADTGRVLPCVGRTCFETLRTPGELREFVEKQRTGAGGR